MKTNMKVWKVTARKNYQPPCTFFLESLVFIKCFASKTSQWEAFSMCHTDWAGDVKDYKFDTNITWVFGIFCKEAKAIWFLALPSSNINLFWVRVRKK